jgi:hypothetical protein
MPESEITCRPGLRRLQVKSVPREDVQCFLRYPAEGLLVILDTTFTEVQGDSTGATLRASGFPSGHRFEGVSTTYRTNVVAARTSDLEVHARTQMAVVHSLAIECGVVPKCGLDARAAGNSWEAIKQSHPDLRTADRSSFKTIRVFFERVTPMNLLLLHDILPR